MNEPAHSPDRPAAHESDRPAAHESASARTPTCALVLSSGGVDSTTCLALAVERFGAAHVAAVSFFYGQRHAKELACAAAVASHYGVERHVLDLADIFAESASALIAGGAAGPKEASYAEQVSASDAGIVNTYVPFRNGLLLSASASFAMTLFPNDACALYLGAHADDAAGDVYPDCSEAFVLSMGRAISIGTYGLVCLEAPFVNKTKADVVACGLGLSVPYEKTWSCYEAGDIACGKCATCIDRRAAFEACGATDPIPYAS